MFNLVKQVKSYHILLIVIGLFLTTFCWLMLQLMSDYSLLWQSQVSLLILIFYVLIIACYYAIVYLVGYLIKNKQSKLAKGDVQVSGQENIIDKRMACRRYLYHKLKWQWYVPLGLQGIVRKKPIFLCFSNSLEFNSHLNSGGWNHLDNPKNLPIDVWDSQHATLIILPFSCDHAFYYQLVLGLLTKYTRWSILSGCLYAVDANDLLLSENLGKVCEQYAYTQKYFSKVLLRCEHRFCIADTDILVGASDAYMIPDVMNELTACGIATAKLSQLESFLFVKMHGSLDVLGNARLNLFYASIKKMFESVKKFSTTKVRFSLLSHYKDSSSDLLSLNESLKNIKQFSQNVYSRRRLFSYAAIISISGLMITSLLCYQFTINRRQIILSQQLLTEYIGLQQSPSDKNNIVASKNLMQIYNISHFASSSWLAPKKASKMVAKAIFPLYQKVLLRDYLAPLQHQLAYLLQNAITKDQDVPRALTTYLSLTDQQHYRVNATINWLKQNQDQLRYPYLMSSASFAILRQLNLADFTSLKSDQLLLEQARQRLPLLTDHLKQLLTQRANQAKQINLYDDLSTTAANILQKKPLRISYFYTKQGYQTEFLPNLDHYIQHISQDNWIYRKDKSFLVGLRQKLLHQYAHSYINAWQSVISQVQLKSVSDTSSAVKLADLASKKQVFWAQLARIISDNTDLSSFSKQFAVINNSVTSHFSSWIHLTNTRNGKKSLNQVQQKFAVIHDYLRKLLFVDSNKKVIFSILAKAYTDGKLTPFDSLNDLFPGLPSAFSGWLQQARQQMVLGMVMDAKQYLTSLWQQQIVVQLQPIMQLYPFKQHASDEISVADFSDKFSQSSELFNFMKTNISPFISLGSGRNHALYSAKMPFTEVDKVFFSHAAAVAQAFFTKPQQQLSVSFRLTPLYLSSSLAKAKLTLLSQDMQYQHDLQTTSSYAWPNLLVSLDAKLTWYSLSGEDRVTFINGVWSWLRLLQSAKLEATQQKLQWKVVLVSKGSYFVLKLDASPAMQLLLSGYLQQMQLPVIL